MAVVAGRGNAHAERMLKLQNLSRPALLASLLYYDSPTERIHDPDQSGLGGVQSLADDKAP